MIKSKYSNYPGFIKRFTFNSEQQTRKDGGTPTDVSFANGIATLNGTSSDISYLEKNLGTIHSIRLKGTFSSVNSNMPIIGNDGNTTCIIVYPSVGIYYSDGTSTISAIACNLDADTKYDIVITREGTTIKGYVNGVQTGVTRTLGSNNDFIFDTIGSYNSGADYHGGTDEFIEYYDRALTDSEINNLKKWNIEPNIADTLLDYNSTNGVIEDRMVGIKVGSDIVNSSPPDFITESWTEGTLTNINGSITNQFLQTNGNDFAGIYKTLLTAGKSYVIIVSGQRWGTGIKFLSDYAIADTDNTIGSVSSGTGEFSFISDFIADNTRFFIHGTSSGNIRIDSLLLYEIRPELSTTDITIKKIGANKYAAKFNGSDSKIDTGCDPIGTKAITVMGWIKPYSFGEVAGYIFTNEKSVFLIDDNNKLRFYSNGSDYGYSDNGSILYHKWQFVSVTRKSDGTVNFYIGDKDTVPALSGSADQNSGTPQSGSTNMIIGNNNGQTRTFDGLIPKLKIVEGILDINQITQYWSETLKEIN